MSKVVFLKMKSSKLEGLIERLEDKNIIAVNTPEEIPNDADIIVRWGNTLAFKKKDNQKVINHANKISLAANKLRALQVMKEAGIPVPNFTTDPAKLNTLKYPILARVTHHTQGTDIRPIFQKQDLKVYEYIGAQIDYFVEYIPTSREFRAHVFGDECFFINRKVFNQPETPYVPFNRSEKNGYFFSKELKAEKPETIEGVAKLGVEAVKSLGLHFGAVDIIKDEEGKLFVLEVNTAPGIFKDEKAYVNMFKKQLKQLTNA